MEPDQILFKKIINLVKKFRKTSPEVEAKTVSLESILPKLTLIARALTGRNIDILAAENEGGWKNDLFYVPAKFNLLPSLEENARYYIYRVVYLCVQSQLGLNWAVDEEKKNIDQAREKAKQNADPVLKLLKENYPSLAEFHEGIKHLFGPEVKNSQLIPDYWLYGKFMHNVAEDGLNDILSPDENGAKKTQVKPQTEIKAKPVEDAEVIEVDTKTQEDYVMTHNFEKVDTAEEFKGVWRNFDGDDDLKKDSEALSELNLKHLVRTDDEVHSVYQSDFRDIRGIAESSDAEDKGRFVTYDEWDFKARKYKPDFCKVFVKRINGISLDYATNTLNENRSTLNGIRRQFAQIKQKREQVRNMADGEEIDLDAIVEMFTEIKSGHTPTENIYFAKRKKEPETSILFLLDLSLSTDSYSAGNRILDVEKQAVLLFGQVLSEYNVDFAVGGFYSKTRNNCSYISLKDFSDDWLKARRNIGAVEPRGYTRIGPALRHAKTLISKRQVPNKWVILLSDGKPNDYDKYEGRYGVADVKQALREMHEYHINTYAIAIESTAKYYLPQMFGQNHYNILSHPNMLINSLTSFYQRIQNH
jgi:nitric oxide reductase NorD protein